MSGLQFGGTGLPCRAVDRYSADGFGNGKTARVCGFDGSAVVKPDGGDATHDFFQREE